MIQKQTRFLLQKNIAAKGFDFAMARDEGHKTFVLKQVVFEEHTQGLQVPMPLQLWDEEAQALMDELWRNGVRPTEAGPEDATQRHLEDMRTIVFDQLGIEK